MSLQTDSVFIAAIQSDATLMAKLGYVAPVSGKGGSPGRLYGTAIPMPDEEVDNVPIPYCIVTYDGMSNESQTKDNSFEGEEDQVNIGILVTGKTLIELHEMTQAVRSAVLAYLMANDTEVEDYQLSAGPIQFDSLNPCYYQTLQYQCDTRANVN